MTYRDDRNPTENTATKVKIETHYTFASRSNGGPAADAATARHHPAATSTAAGSMR